MELIAIDPGKNTGVAWFYGGFLAEAYLRTNIEPVRVSSDTLVVCEIPFHYPGGRSKGDGNSLISVARQAGRLTALVPESRLKFVFPRSWKGTMPDHVIFPRIAERLSKEERGRIPGLEKFLTSKFTGVLGNVLDAVGIGLKELGRL